MRTLLKEWAYARPFTDTADRIALLPQFLDFYNRVRPHWSLSGQPPMSRVPVNNPIGEEQLAGRVSVLAFQGPAMIPSAFLRAAS